MASTGALRSSACVWGFSSTHSTTALSGGLRYRPMTSRTLASSCGSVENLKLCVRHGCSPHSRHTSATLTLEMPSSAASSRDDQCVTPSRFGGGSRVASTMATSSVVRRLARPGPVLQPADALGGVPLLSARSPSAWTPRSAARSRSSRSRPRPAARSGPAGPARPGSTATAPTRPARHDLAAEPPAFTVNAINHRP